MWLLGITLIVAGVIVAHFASDRIPAWLLVNYRPWLIASGAVLLAGGLVVFFGRKRLPVTVAAAGLCGVLACQLALWGYQSVTPSKSGRDMARVIKAYDPSNTVPVYMINTYSPSLPFYLRRLVTMVMYKGELQLGISAEPWRSIPTAKAFATKWRHSTRGIAVFSNENIDWFRKNFDLPMTVLEHGPRRTIVARTPKAGAEK